MPLRHKLLSQDANEDDFESGPWDTPRLLQLYKARFGLDFSLYKRATIDRRIERRLQARSCRSIEEYVQILESESEELETLYRDLLVEVTQFFRDSDAYEILRKDVIPRLINAKGRQQSLRVWVPGCATGEEAYSLAMLISDCAEELDRNVQLRMFATDVHRSSVDFAGQAVYSREAVQNVPAKLRNRYFTETNDGWQISQELRQRVVVATHDLTSDPPFTRMDLVSCRNLLIYFEPSVQQSVLGMLHFAMNQHGVLFLGPSETTGQLSKEFEVVDQHWRIFRKLRDVRLPEATRLPITGPSRRHVAPQPEPVSRRLPKTPEVDADNRWLKPVLYEELLSRYVPPCLIVNQDHELIHTFGDVRRLLVQPEGAPTLNITKLLEGRLAMVVTAGLHQATRTRDKTAYSDIPVTNHQGEEKHVRVVIEAYQKGSRDLFMVCLEEQELPPETPAVERQFDAAGTADSRIAELESNLDSMRQSLQAAVEELETSNEELQAANEELVASNEELQSTNEELHSVNEELFTVNVEHQDKIDELMATAKELKNVNDFIANTSIGMVFLDEDLRIRRFTPAINEVLRILDRDIGRPIEDISCRLDDPDLIRSIRAALENGISTRRQVARNDGAHFLTRIIPFQDSFGFTNGVVLAFDDVTEISTARRQLLEVQGFAYAVSHDLQEPIRAIRGYVDVLQSECVEQLNVASRKALDTLASSGRQIQSMVDSLLRLSRVFTRGKVFQQVRLDELLKNAQSRLQDRIRELDAEIIVEDLPTLVCDPAQIEEAFVELLDNSLKFKSDDSPQVHIQSTLSNDDVLITIRDNGIGIDPAHHEKIFQVFQRPVARNRPGNGCGLTYCRHVLDRHSGTISVKSKLDAGSSFILKLPLNPIDQAYYKD